MFLKKLFIFSLLSAGFIFELQSKPDKAIESKKSASKTEVDAEEDNKVELNFQNASLGSILEYLAEQKGISLVPPGKDMAEKKISMTTRNPMELDDAWDALMTLMELHGFRLIRNGKLHKVGPAKESVNEPMRVFSSTGGRGLDELPDSGEVVTFIYYLTNMKADQASAVISAVSGEKPILFSDLDICIIRGPSYKIKSALKILEPFDKEQLKQTMVIMRLKHTAPEVVAKLVSEEIAGGKGGDQQRIRFVSSHKKDVSFLSPSVRIIPDPGHGTLIMLGQEKQIKKTREFIEKFIDIEWGSDKSRVKIKEINYRGADQLQRTLEKIIKSANQGGQNRQPAFRDVKIVAETPQGGGKDSGFGSGNRLIISCDPEDWAKLDSLVDNLDSLKPQIVLEVMIVDASLGLTRALEGHIRDTGVGLLGRNVSWAITNIGGTDDITQSWNSLSPAIGGAIENPAGDSLVTFGNSNKSDGSDLWGLLKTAFSESNSNIISQPFLVVNNGEESYFNDQQDRRVAGELSSRGQTQIQKQENATVKNTVTITPRMNVDEIVDMKIDVTVEEFTKAAGLEPDTSRRSLTTKVAMSMGEVLVLGGLSRRKKTESKFDTPLLGEVPIIGNFFKSKRKGDEEKTLFMFVRPSLIKPRDQVEPDDYTQFKLDYAKLNIKRTDDFAKEKDPIAKAFFKPTKMSVREAEEYSRSETYPPVDDFAQRKKLPISTDIKNDTYYRVKNKASQSAKPQIAAKQPPQKNKAFPHLQLKKRSMLDADG